MHEVKHVETKTQEEFRFRTVFLCLFYPINQRANQ